MAASLSMDFRERIVSAHEAGNISLQDVANRFGVYSNIHEFESFLRLKWAHGDSDIKLGM